MDNANKTPLRVQDAVATVGARLDDTRRLLELVSYALQHCRESDAISALGTIYVARRELLDIEKSLDELYEDEDEELKNTEAAHG